MRDRDRLYGPSKKVWALVPELKPGMRIVFSPKMSDKVLGNSTIVREAIKKFGGRDSRPDTPVVFVRIGIPLPNDHPTILVKGARGEESVVAIGYVFCDEPNCNKHICKEVTKGKILYSSAGQGYRGRAHRTTFGGRR